MTEVTTLRIDPANVAEISRTVLSDTGVFGFELKPQTPSEVTIKSCIFPNSHIALHAYSSTGHEFSVSHHPYFTIDTMLEGSLLRALDEDKRAVNTGELILGHPGQMQVKLEEDATTGTSRGMSCFVSPEAAEYIMRSNGLRLTQRQGQVVADGFSAAAKATKRLLEYAHEEFFVRGLQHVSPGRARLFEALLSDHIAELFESYGYAEKYRSKTPDSLKVVLEFEDLAKAKFSEAESVSELANEAGTSLRSLQRAFKKHRGITPSLYLSTLRLEAARSQLLSAADSDTVTEIVYRCGINHLGRFSANYRSVYGESPQETLTRSKA